MRLWGAAEVLQQMPTIAGLSTTPSVALRRPSSGSDPPARDQCLTPLARLLFRRRLVLQFGSFDQFFHRNPTRAFEEEARLEALAWDLYVNIEDGGELIRTLRPEADEFCGAEPGADTPWRVPEEGYSVEERRV